MPAKKRAAASAASSAPKRTATDDIDAKLAEMQTDINNIKALLKRIADKVDPEPVAIFVKDIDDRTLTVFVLLDKPVVNIMQSIYEKSSVPPEAQRLIFAGRQLDPDATPRSYGMQKESTVHLVRRLRGD